jgi:hypothetical protein
MTSSDPFGFWRGIVPGLSYLSQAPSKNTIGVVNNTIYDILPDNPGVGNVAVGAQSFDVTCGGVKNATVIGTPSKKPTSWKIHGHYRTTTFSYNITETRKLFSTRLAQYSHSAPSEVPCIIGRVQTAPLGTIPVSCREYEMDFLDVKISANKCGILHHRNL